VIAQLLKFASVGVVNTLISLAIYAILLASGGPYLLAAGVGFAAGAVNGYVLNRIWLTGLFAVTGLVRLFVDLGVPRFPAYLAAVAPVTLATFAANRLWTFSQRPHSRLTAPAFTFQPWTR
jgi:putative flippase GtrA